MKSKMTDEDDILLGDLEQLLFDMNEFCAPTNSKQDEIPPPLENYLKYVAKTGDTVFPWQHVRPLFRIKMLSAINNFTGEISANEAFVIERFDLFRAAPFTIQRFAELVTQPNRHYKLKEKFLRGLEKTVLVVTTVQPKSSSSGDPHSSGESIDNEEEDSSTDDTMVWTSHSSDGDTCVTSMPIPTTTSAVHSKVHVTNTNEETGATELSSSSASLEQPVVTSELSLQQVVTTTTGNTTTHHPVESLDDPQGQGLTLLEQQTSNASANLEPGTSVAPEIPPSPEIISVGSVESDSETGISDTIMPTTVADVVEATLAPSLDFIPEEEASAIALEEPILDIEPSLTSIPPVSVPETAAVPLPEVIPNQDLSMAPIAVAEAPAADFTSVPEQPVALESSSMPTETLIDADIDIDARTEATAEGSDCLAPEPAKKPKIDIDTTLTTYTPKIDMETKEKILLENPKDDSNTVEEPNLVSMVEEPGPGTEATESIILPGEALIAENTEKSHVPEAENPVPLQPEEELSVLATPDSLNVQDPEPMEQDEAEEEVPSISPDDIISLDSSCDPSAAVVAGIVSSEEPSTLATVETNDIPSLTLAEYSANEDATPVVDTTTSES